MSQTKHRNAKDRLLKSQADEIERLKKQIASFQTVVQPEYDHGHDQEIRVSILGHRPNKGGGTAAKYDNLDDLVKYCMATRAGPLENLYQKFFMAFNPKTARKGYIEPLIERGVIEIYYDEKAKCDMWKWIYREYPSGASL